MAHQKLPPAEVPVGRPSALVDPRKFKDPHDKAQWERLHSLSNPIDTDGNAFSLWQDGEWVDSVVTPLGDLESAGLKRQAPPGLLGLFEHCFRWESVPPQLSTRSLKYRNPGMCLIACPRAHA